MLRGLPASLWTWCPWLVLTITRALKLPHAIVRRLQEPPRLVERAARDAELRPEHIKRRVRMADRLVCRGERTVVVGDERRDRPVPCDVVLRVMLAE